MKISRLLGYVSDMFNQGLDLIFPGASGCPLCRSFGRCNCRESLLESFYSRSVCSRCGKFLVEDTQCLECTVRGKGFPERVYALAPYSGAIRQAIHNFKYRADKQAGRYLADLLWEGPGREVSRPDIIIPVPLHLEKQRRRGFNQALLLAEYLGSKFDLPVDPFALERIVSTQPQSALTRAMRQRNLFEAFTCGKPEKVREKRVLLVDDIITTGFTMEACGAALRTGGVVAIEGICLAAGCQKN